MKGVTENAGIPQHKLQMRCNLRKTGIVMLHSWVTMNNHKYHDLLVCGVTVWYSTV
jgi:hypothetical protein